MNTTVQSLCQRFELHTIGESHVQRNTTCHVCGRPDVEIAIAISGDESVAFHIQCAKAFLLELELERAVRLMKALLGAPPPKLWSSKYPNTYKQAVEFIHRNERSSN